MARRSESPDDEVEGVKASQDSETSSPKAALKAKLSRKRTKTGCLTCRRRHIKCAEERPVCGNCIKSKRHCESYNQRAIFKSCHFDDGQAPHEGAHFTRQTDPIAGFPPYGQPACTEYGFDYMGPTDLRPRQPEHGHPDFHDTFHHQEQYLRGTVSVHQDSPIPVQPMPANAMYQQLQPGIQTPFQQRFQVPEFQVSAAKYSHSGTLPAVSCYSSMAIPTMPLPYPPMIFPTTAQCHPSMALPTASQQVPYMALPLMTQCHSETVPQHASAAPQMHTSLCNGSPSVPTSSCGSSSHHDRRLSLQTPTTEIAAPYSGIPSNQTSDSNLGYVLDYQQACFTSQQPYALPYETSGPTS